MPGELCCLPYSLTLFRHVLLFLPLSPVVGDLFQITTDPKVQKRVMQADRGNTGRISRQDILKVMQSEATGEILPACSTWHAARLAGWQAGMWQLAMRSRGGVACSNQACANWLAAEARLPTHIRAIASPPSLPA